jgi:hypothetical protein
MTIKLKIRFRLRVAAAALALALGWISTPLSLASWESDVCEMECCIAEGHCCCATRRAYVKGQEPKPGDVSISLETTLTNPCPAGCLASGFTAQNKLPRSAHAHAPITTPGNISVKLYRDRFLLDRQFVARPSSPRAPPASDRFIA